MYIDVLHPDVNMAMKNIVCIQLVGPTTALALVALLPSRDKCVNHSETGLNVSLLCSQLGYVHGTVQGEYVAPEKIENVYVRCPLIAQSFVYGDSLRPQLVAVVVPDPEALQPWAASRKLTQDVAALCSDPKVNKAILKSMQEEGRAAGLKGFEQVRFCCHTCVKNV